MPNKPIGHVREYGWFVARFVALARLAEAKTAAHVAMTAANQTDLPPRVLVALTKACTAAEDAYTAQWKALDAGLKTAAAGDDVRDYIGGYPASGGAIDPRILAIVEAFCLRQAHAGARHHLQESIVWDPVPYLTDHDRRAELVRQAREAGWDDATIRRAVQAGELLGFGTSLRAEMAREASEARAAAEAAPAAAG
jgi:hypothetical protein